MTSEPQEQGFRNSGTRVVDVDIHVNDTPERIAPYCEMPWRKSLEAMGPGPHRYLDIAGWSPSTRALPPIPGGHALRSVSTAKQMREELDELGIDDGILLPDYLLFFANLQNPEYATAVGKAYNRWITAEWAQPENGLFAALLADPHHPSESAKDIEHYAGNPGIKAVYLPTAGITPLWGHRMYDPILSAAESAGLPVVFHSVTIISSAFPSQIDQFENQFGRHVIGHSFAMQANLVSLMHTGVPVRHPKLKVVFSEAGISWVPHIMWRMDKYHQEMRRTVPILEERPSEYLKRQMWFATQPIEEPDDPMELVETIRHCGGADRILFASDWPHHDFDHPRAMRRLPLTPEDRRKIMGENAAAIFNLPARAKQKVTVTT